jgi:adenylate kinase family enzyme
MALALVQKYGLMHLDLDTLAWEVNNPTIRRKIEDSLKDLSEFIKTHDNWVIEGCYSSLLKEAISHCTKLIFLNPGIDICVQNCLSRPWESHKYSSPEAQNKNLKMLIDWVKQYEIRDDEFSLKSHRQLFARFSGEKIEYLSNERNL